MMNFSEIILKRHSVRNFSDKLVEPEKLSFIFTCANSCPSAGNLMAYQIYQVYNKEKIKQIAIHSSNQLFIAEAPLVMVICACPEVSKPKYGERGVLYALQDATIAASYMQLAAVEMELGSCWVGAFDTNKIAEIVGIPILQNVVPIVVMPIGYPKLVKER